MTGRAGVRLCGVVLAAVVVLGVRVLEAQVDQSIDQAQVHVFGIVADKDSPTNLRMGASRRLL
jgi:hypothetical protein